MVEDALSFWTEIQRYEDMLAADAKSLCFAPLSELYRKLGLLDDAIMVAEKGCAAHPDLPAGFLALGTACYAKGLTGQARGALERAVALQPNHLEALKLLGQLYVEQNEVVLARKVLELVQRQDPDDLESSLLLNSVAVAPSEEEPEELLEDLEVIEELEEVVEEFEPEPAPSQGFAAPLSPAVEPARPQAPAAAAPAQDDDLWAIEDLEEVEVEPLPKRKEAATPDPLTTATLAELYVSQGFIEKAMGIYKELITAHPANSQYRLRCAELQEMQELQHGCAEPESPAKGPAAATPPAAVELPEETDDLEAGWDLPVETGLPIKPKGVPEVERTSELVIPAAMETPTTLEFPATAEAAFAIDSPAVMEEPALEALETQSAPSATVGEVEVELQRWLENIRRRKDGV